MSRVELDATYLMSAGIEAKGLADADLDAIAERARAAVRETAGLRASGKVGFFDLPRDAAAETVAKAVDYASRLGPEIENMVVLGIGGSSLGAKVIYRALARPFEDLRPRAAAFPRRLFFPDNIDPATFRAVLDLCPLEKTVWNVVTKSGGTVETAAQLLVVVEELERRLGKDAARRHLVLTTDPAKGVLRRLANDFGLEAFAIPPAVGGRFSALSAVGLLPAAVAGLDVNGLLEGAQHMVDVVAEEQDVRRNPALLLAACLYLHDRERRRPIHVMMPYVDCLYETAEWFRQLWAESLGKARDVEGREIHVGPTPIAARGATDQHSQLQLFVEGPDDKVLLFVTVKERGPDVSVPRGVLAQYEELAYLGGHGLGKILEAERLGTRLALARAGRPSATITLERVDARALGELTMLLEAATAFAGPLYRVNPYDQPGVEEGKRFAFGLLGRKEFESFSKAAEGETKRDPRFIL
ncbi:MAG: glucose-6-phosphate isomerase [Pseudomonadota bacterium]